MRRLVQGLVLLALALAPADGNIAISDVPVTAGGELKFGLSGFNCENIAVTLGTRSLGNVIGGTLDVTKQVPPDMPSGEYTLTASCIGGPDTAGAQVRVVGPTGRQRIALTPGSTQPGAVVTVDGTAFDDCIQDFTTNDGTATPVQVSILLDSTVVGAASITEDGSGEGTFRTTFTVPPDAAAADHQVAALCRNRFLPGSSSATATLTVLGSPDPSPTTVPPGGGGSGDTPRPPPGGDPPAGPGSGIAPIGIIAVIVAIGLVALRRRLRPAGAAAVPLRVPRSSQGLPQVAARAAGLGSGPAQISPGPGRDVSIRVVARAGGVR